MLQNYSHSDSCKTRLKKQWSVSEVKCHSSA